jgi:nucleotide-binding universal stress UspA family protein
MADAQGYLDAVVRRLGSRGGYAHTRVKLGSPELGLARLADQEHVDVIVMATHGRSGLVRFVLGSVATRTLQRASVPVMLIRPSSLPSQPPERQEARTGAR